MDGLPPDQSNKHFRKVTRLDSTEVCLDADMIRLLIAIDERKPLGRIAAEASHQGEGYLKVLLFLT